MKTMMVLVAAAAGAAGTFYWLRGGGELEQVKDKAMNLMGRAEQEAGYMADDVTSSMDAQSGYAAAEL